MFASFNCKPQNKKQTEVEKIKHYNMENKHEYNKLVNKEFERFNIKRFDENKDEAEDYVYFLEDSTRVREFGDTESGYFSQLSKKDSFFTISKGFYPNSNIKCKGPSFKDDCEIGIWYDFDEKGELIKVRDLDESFKLTIEDILLFLKKNNLNYERYFSINRSYDPSTKKGTWSLLYNGTYKNKQGLFDITLDDQTKELEYVAQIVGKEGEKIILINKKKETLLIDEDNSKKNNNLILITLLFLALALIVGGLIYISQRSQIPSP
jgi:hypothetical protein